MNTRPHRSTFACEFAPRRDIVSDIARLLHDADQYATHPEPGCAYEAKRLRRIAEAEAEQLRRAELGLTPA